MLQHKNGLLFISNLVTHYLLSNVYFIWSINLKLEENLLSILLERFCIIHLKLVKLTLNTLRSIFIKRYFKIDQHLARYFEH